MAFKIGIRPTIDGRMGGVRESLEDQTMQMAKNAKKLIESNVFYANGKACEVIISPCTIGGTKESAICEEYFNTNNVIATLTVSPCWCYGTEVMDMNRNTLKAVWGFNGTERPGAVYLACAMAGYAQKGLPAYSIYGKDVQDAGDTTIPSDVEEKILRFARCAMVVGAMKDKTYLSLGSVSMGIAGSCVDAQFMQKYLGIRTEWNDMTEVLRRVKLGIYDHEEFAIARQWVRDNCPTGTDFNPNPRTPQELEEDWDFCVKHILVCRDLMHGNPKLAKMGWAEEANGKNAIAAGFQGQRAWTDWLPNADFTEAILCSSFDWTGTRQPSVFATENDSLNAISMVFGNLLTGTAPAFSDVRTYWSADAVKRVTGWKPEGKAKDGFIHLINSGATCLDATGASKENGKNVMKQWWKVDKNDISAMLKATDWAPANLQYFRGSGFSSHFKTGAEMPITLIRINLVEGLGPVLQFAEGWTVSLPQDVHAKLDERTDKTWPTTWFVPNLTGEGAFKDVYSVMANWGANHGAFVYGHIGQDLITLSSMLRIPVNMHNVCNSKMFRPQCWSAFGTQDSESADYKACTTYGALYK